MHSFILSTAASTAITAVVLAAGAAFPLAAQAQHNHSHGHVHGMAALHVAVEAGSITLELEAPLEDVVGFEREPRDAAERERVARVVQQLKAADTLFKPDPAGQCRLAAVSLDAAPLGLKPEAAAHVHDHGKDSDKSSGKEQGKHADLHATYRFDCAATPALKFVELGVNAAFPGVRTIKAQVVSPKGQSQRTLRKGQTRLTWR